MLSVVELLCLSLTVEALQCKMCQNSLPSGVGRSLGTKISGGRVVRGEYFLVSAKLDIFCYRFDTIPACDGQTDGQTRTDGIAIANTALAMRALRRAVKTQHDMWVY